MLSSNQFLPSTPSERPTGEEGRKRKKKKRLTAKQLQLQEHDSCSYYCPEQLHRLFPHFSKLYSGSMGNEHCSTPTNDSPPSFLPSFPFNVNSYIFYPDSFPHLTHQLFSITQALCKRSGINKESRFSFHLLFSC